MNRRSFLKTILGGVASTFLPSLPGSEAAAEPLQAASDDGWVHVVCHLHASGKRELWLNGSRMAEEAFADESPVVVSQQNRDVRTAIKSGSVSTVMVEDVDDIAYDIPSLEGGAPDYPFSVDCWVKHNPRDYGAQPHRVDIAEAAIRLEGEPPVLHWKAQ